MSEVRHQVCSLFVTQFIVQTVLKFAPCNFAIPHLMLEYCVQTCYYILDLQ